MKSPKSAYFLSFFSVNFIEFHPFNISCNKPPRPYIILKHLGLAHIREHHLKKGNANSKLGKLITLILETLLNFFISSYFEPEQ